MLRLKLIHVNKRADSNVETASLWLLRYMMDGIHFNWRKSTTWCSSGFAHTLYMWHRWRWLHDMQFSCRMSHQQVQRHITSKHLVNNTKYHIFCVSSTCFEYFNNVCETSWVSMNIRSFYDIQKCMSTEFYMNLKPHFHKAQNTPITHIIYLSYIHTYT